MDASKLIGAVNSVTGKWAKQRKAEERKSSAEANREHRLCRSYQVTIREVAFREMERAYQKASGGGKLPVLARQIYYAARGPILLDTDHDKLDSKYFIQNILTEYIECNPEAVAHWNLAFDARGHLKEPHYDDRDVALGTIEVRDYLNNIKTHTIRDPEIRLSDKLYPTNGPKNRYQAILYIEKEGFHPHLEAAKIQERYDVALMSTKGLSTTASRLLVDSVCSEHNIPLLVFHDFDFAGFSILYTLSESNRRYRYKGKHQVIDLGIRLEDIEKYDLESESVFYGKRGYDPSAMLKRNGATQAEIDFLYHGLGDGERVELNAFTSDQFIEWIESKLEANGIKKLIPDNTTLEDAFRRAITTAHIDKKTKEILEDAKAEGAAATVPDDLKEQIEDILEDNPALSWDQAIQELVTDEDKESNG